MTPAPEKLRIGICAIGAVSQDTGGRTYLFNFINTCVSEKLPHEFFIFYSGPAEDIWGELPPNFHKITIPGTNTSSWTKVIGEQALLPFHVLGKKLDVMYFPGNFVTVFLRLPKVVAIRSTLFYHFPQEVPRWHRWHRKIFSWLTVRLADQILVPSESIARDVVRFMGARREKITVVPHGVDITKFSNRLPPAQIDERLKALGVQRPYFLFVSALWHYKGAQCFLDSLTRLRQQPGYENVQGVMAGKGIGADRYSQLLQQQVVDTHLSEAVIFVGHRSHDDLACLYWGAEALVFPSYYESFGNPLVEAMAAGTPIIASNRHAVPDTVAEAGLIVDPDDTEKLVAAMKQVMTDPILRARLVETGRQRASTFSWPLSVRGALRLVAWTRRPRILLFGYLPPPVFGPSVTYLALLHSSFAHENQVTFINMSLVTDVKQLEKVQLDKFWRVLKMLFLELWHLTTSSFDFCCCPISVNRNAFVKDAILLMIARLSGMPTVLYAHGNNLPDFHQRSSPLMRQLIERTASRAAGVIVLGESLRFNFDQWLPPEKIFVVPTGIEPSPPAALPSHRATGVTVLYLGNLVREKGVFVLLEAAALVARQRPDMRFVFAGGWFRADDEAQARQSATGNVEFIGPVRGESKAQALAQADLLAFPTFYYYETMGLVLLEAMQAGLPVVTTRRATIPEIIEDGVNGCLVNEQDPPDLADKIIRLADDRAMRQRMGQANRAKFLAQYTHEQYGARMTGVFRTLQWRRINADGRKPA